MPRYIDADKLIKELIDKGFYPAIVKSAIENAPTEDVVPRSEVEELQKKLNDYKRFVGDIRVTGENHAVIIDSEHTKYIDKRVAEGLKNLAVKQAKQEVAREIFEEIVKCLIFNTYEIACISKNDIAEIRNKYIGE